MVRRQTRRVVDDTLELTALGRDTVTDAFDTHLEFPERRDANEDYKSHNHYNTSAFECRCLTGCTKIDSR